MSRRDQLVLYRGYGAGDRIFVQGRALEHRLVAPAAEDHSRWRNLLGILRRAHARPIAHARVRVGTGDSTRELTADDEGFFAGWLPVTRPVFDRPGWVALVGELLGAHAGSLARGEAYYPERPPEQLVISDIDDTVLQSRVTNFVRAAQTLAFGNARTRLPFPGVAAFYHALRVGASGAASNPLFYVSSSPWNLYDLITEFLELQGIPPGPVLLRDLDINLAAIRSSGHHDHKGDNIRRILDTYPSVPVILIGDSGQQDPEIYHGIVHEYAGRVRAVYIRNVTMNAARSAAIQRLADEVLAVGSSLVLADDTLAAARHAAEHGFIPAQSLADVGSETRADEGRTDEKADAPEARSPDDAPTPTVVVDDGIRTTDQPST